MSHPQGRALLRRYLPFFGSALYAAGVGFAAWGAQSALGAGVRILSLAILGLWAAGRRSLTVWIFWSMLVGVETGLDVPAFALHLHIFSELFLRLIEAIVAPLILGTLITGVAAHGDSREVTRLSVKSLIYFEVLTTIALAIGLIAINVSRAGVGVSVPKTGSPPSAVTASGPEAGSQPFAWEQFLLHVVPENLAKSVAENQILQVAVFAVLFGLALGRIGEETKRPLLNVLQSLTATMFQFTNLVMYSAPIAVGSALAYTVAHSGFHVMFSLSKLVLTLYVAIAAFVLVGMLPAAILFRVPLRRFIAAVAEPATIAFATSTSEAALPIAMERMEELGVPRRIVGFVIPTGYSFNLAGSALYLSLASIFAAQSGGVPMSLGTQLMLMGTLMLTSKGVAGVPRAVLIVLLATAASFRLPLDTIAALLGVDVLMDMGRTTVNVVGNCLASVAIAQWEGEFVLSPEPETQALAPDAG
ncbi:MAG TPA: cation:dicarboxylase symporter family transporter [Acidobacteriaceae bacterium]|nr:cation:dicarboxylase symporter family transporter [Acidobacteriaceae bacterium]